MSYVDSNLNSVWDTGETVVWDANSNGLYDAGELVVPGTGPAPSPGILLGTPGTVTLLAGQSRTITLNWTSSDSLPRGRYMIGAAIAPVTGEFNTANNGILFFQFVQRLRGDANADCTVNILDVGVITGGLGQTFGVGDPRLWRPAADMNNDLTINILDIGVVTGYLGHTCTTG